MDERTDKRKTKHEFIWPFMVEVQKLFKCTLQTMIFVITVSYCYGPGHWITLNSMLLYLLIGAFFWWKFGGISMSTLIITSWHERKSVSNWYIQKPSWIESIYLTVAPKLRMLSGWGERGWVLSHIFFFVFFLFVLLSFGLSCPVSFFRCVEHDSCCVCFFVIICFLCLRSL